MGSSSKVVWPEEVLESLKNDGTIDALGIKIIAQLKANVDGHNGMEQWCLNTSGIAGVVRKNGINSTYSSLWRFWKRGTDKSLRVKIKR